MSRKSAHWHPPQRTAPAHPPFVWYGGKWMLAGWIIPKLRPHHIYVETCGGAGSVLTQKPPSPVEVFNDIDRVLANFFRVCRDHFHELARAIALSPYHRGEYFEALKTLRERPPKNPIERARLFIVIANQSFAGRFGGSWGFSRTHSARGMASQNSRWLHMAATIYQVADRLQEVQIECLPALRLIKLYDSKQTLYYCDPPYHPDTRQTTEGYVHEMTAEDHAALLEAVNVCQANVALSGYRCPQYDKALKRWTRFTRDVPCTSRKVNAGESRPRRLECLWVKR